MRPARCLLLSAVLVAVMSLAGCGGGGAIAPVGRVVPSPQRDYVVQKGDTLYYVAWRFAKDYMDIARYNGLSDPYTIFPGQHLRLEPPSQAVTLTPVQASPPVKPTPVPGPSKPVVSPSPSAAPPPKVSQSADVGVTRNTAPAVPKAQTRPAKLDDDAPVTRWVWPARGTVLAAFGSGGGNGIEIGGKTGQPVVASAPGTVVYSGSGLIGYGKLIIVKHNKSFLSAYAHNEKILVNEGDRVDLGQQIAQMGSSGSDRVKLHFEIRRDGKPVDPKRYLPK